jgi:hypothetical protein
MMRHPGEPYVPFVVGLRAAHSRDDNPLPWLGATLERATVYGPAHLVLARLLVGASPAQARMEYRLAVTQAPLLRPVVEREASALVGGYDDARELVPEGEVGVAMMESLAVAVGPRLPATRARLEKDVALRSPRAPGPARAAAEDAVADLEAGEAAPWCTADQRGLCGQRALELSLELERVAPSDCEGHALEARVFAAQADGREAVRRLRLAAQTSPDRDGCLRALVDQAIAAGDGDEADVALQQLARPPCAGGEPACLERLRWVAQRQEARGHAGHAALTLRRACEAAPWDDGLLAEAARVASAAGLHAEALADYQLLLRREPANPLWPQKVNAESTAVARAASSF